MQEIASVVSRMASGRSWTNGYNTREADSQTIGRLMEPVTLADLDTSHPIVKTAVTAVRRWGERYKTGEERAPSLVLSGPNGVGKTHIARAILWSLKMQATDVDGTVIAGSVRPRGRFFHAAELLAQLSPDDEGRLGAVGSLVGSAPLVVVDDVGAESTLAYVAAGQQDHERQVRYFRFVDWCDGNDVPVIITTNLTLPELAEHVGRRAWDRLLRMAPAGQMVSLFGVPSWRVKEGGR